MRLTSSIDSADATSPEAQLRIESHRQRGDEPTLKMIFEDEHQLPDDAAAEGGPENVERT
jgi:hypothetical protein